MRAARTVQLPSVTRWPGLPSRSRDTATVVEHLGLVALQPCSWRSGIGSVYDNRLGNDHIFVSPPVNGWTFVVGLALPYPVGGTFVDKCTPLLDHLGNRFVEVQYFFAYPPIDLFAWARLLEGRLVRAFAITDTGIVWNKGRTTKEERTLGLKLFDFRGVRGRRATRAAKSSSIRLRNTFSNSRGAGASTRRNSVTSRWPATAWATSHSRRRHGAQNASAKPANRFRALCVATERMRPRAKRAELGS